MLLYSHRHLIDCDNEEDCVEDGVPSLMEIFDLSMLNSESKITANDDLVAGPEVYISALDVIAAKRQIYKLSVLPETPSAKTFLSHIIY